MKIGKIYCLKDPITLEIKYIGFTRNTINTRFSQHKHEALKKNTLSHCYNWFRMCVKNGKLPIISLIEDNVPLNKWAEREQYWIDKYNNLTNQKSGGNGVHLNTNSIGRTRSIDAKKLSIMQLTLDGKFIKEWDSIIEAEKNIIGHYTGNIYRAASNYSTAFGFIWILKQEYDEKNTYSFVGKHWSNIYLYCVYTLKLIRFYNKASDLVKDLSITPSLITQAIKKNLILKKLYFIRNSDNILNPPKPNTIYTYNNNYYTSFNELYKNEHLPYSLGYQKQRRNNYKVIDITDEIIQKLKNN